MKVPKCKLYRVQGGAGGGGVARARGGARQAAAGDLQRRHIQGGGATAGMIHSCIS